MRRYPTLRNVCAQKLSYFRAKWSILPCKTQPFETVAENYTSSDVSTNLFTDEKNIYSGQTEKPKESPTVGYANAATNNQQKIHYDKMPAKI